MIGAACNSRIPPANLHAGLNFCTCREFNPLKYHLVAGKESIVLGGGNPPPKKKQLVLLQKVIGHPFDHFACGICELHATPFMLAIYSWENLIQEKPK